MRIRLLLPSALLLAGCASAPPTAVPVHTTIDTPAPVVAEAWRSAPVDGGELDSLALWPTPDGAAWLLVTAKRSHQLQVLDADTGRALQVVGRQGTAPGEFDRPNGIAVYGDLAFVVERDNARVQVLSLPGFQPQLVFGAPQLRSPYGLWLHEVAPGTLEVYVTDSFMDPPDHSGIPPFDSLDQRVQRFRVEGIGDEALSATWLSAFGATDPASALRMVESIAGDPAHDRLLIADEDTRHHATLRDYTLDGQPRGTSVAPDTFAAEPEGVALWPCTVDTGYWVAADQLRPRTMFHLLDRQSLAHAGRFTGAFTAYTDGIALHPGQTARFRHGALFAVHEDTEVVAFDLRDVADSLQLDRGCME